ncbi:MAG TPA: GAF domain-containing protein, partial [Nitrospiria bacterium]|nr:GAF domain-containing protein [Nitrospiria bacterium]
MKPRSLSQKRSPGRRKTDSGGVEARLRKRLEIERAKREVLQEIGRVSPERRSPEKLYDHYLGVILKITRTQSGSIHLLNEVSGELVQVARKGRAINGFSMKKGKAGFEDLAARVIRSGRPFTGNGKIKIIKKTGRSVIPAGRGMVAVPLRISGRVQGVLEVHQKKDRKPFLPDDLDLLNAIASQLSTVIENTRMVRKYTLKVKKLEAMREVSRLLNSTLDESEVRWRAVEAATALMDAEAGSLLLIDRVSRELYFEVALGPGGEKVKEIRLKIGEGIAGWVAKTGRPVIVSDVQKDPRFSRAADKKSDYTTRTMLCVPVRVKGKTAGVLQAINKLGGGSFSRWDLEDFQSLGDQVAVAIENADLYRELREAFFGTVQALGEAIEAKDAYTAGHTQRVLTYSETVGRRMGLSDEDLDDLRLAAVLHDVGKIGIEDRILRKPGKLEEPERRRMK